MAAIKVHKGPIFSDPWQSRKNILLQASVDGADDDSLDELENEVRSDKHSLEEWERLESAAFEVLGAIRPKGHLPKKLKGNGLQRMAEERERGHHHFMP